MNTIQRISHLSWRWTGKSRSIFIIDVSVSRKFIVCNVVKRNYCRFEEQSHRFVAHLQKVLPVSDATGLKIFYELPALHPMDQLKSIGPTIKFLLSQRITTESIVGNSFLLAMKRDEIVKKLNAIKTMNPIDVNDFVPLMELTWPQLNRVVEYTIAKRENLPDGHRIYFFSNELNVDAQTMAKIFVRHSELLTTSFDTMHKKLRILRDHNVETSQIIETFYVFRNSEQKIISRLEQFDSMGISDIPLTTFSLGEADFQKKLSTMRKTPASSVVQVQERKNEIRDEIHNLLPCSVEQAATIYYNHIRCWDELMIARENLSFLRENHIDEQSIVENSFLLTMDRDEIKERLRIVADMKPKHIVDFLSLLKIETSILVKIAKRTKNEPKQRIYLFSEKLQVKPSIVADAFSAFVGIFFLEYVFLSPKLDVLLSYDFPSENILSCLSVFKNSASTMTHKLNQRSTTGNEPIKLSLLSGHRLNRLEERRNTKMQNEDVTSYLVQTLAWTKQQTSKYQIDHPVLFRFSVTECAEIIDFLLNEASYTIDDINNELGILRCDLSEVKQRFQECKMMTFKPKLYMLRLSREKYLTRMKNVSRDRVDGAAIIEYIGKRVATNTKTVRRIHDKIVKNIDKCENIKNFLAERLAWSDEQTTKYQNTYPHLFNINKTKLSETLDFLLNKASYTTDLINGYLSIFNYDLLEMKCRFSEYKSLNHQPKLYMLMQSPSKYLRQIKKICDAKDGGDAAYDTIEIRVCERKAKSKSKEENIEIE